jgi:hypothetical protein
MANFKSNPPGPEENCDEANRRQKKVSENSAVYMIKR